jgi:hypothetical protein
MQDLQAKDEEHQEGEVDNELHTTNDMIVYDDTLSSDDSYYAQINDNCSEEALCLDANFGNFNVYEVDIELCYESCGANMHGKDDSPKVADLSMR